MLVEGGGFFLFDGLGVTGAFGMLHPDNTASAMVLERMGFLYEGHTKFSFWLDDLFRTTG